MPLYKQKLYLTLFFAVFCEYITIYKPIKQHLVYIRALNSTGFSFLVTCLYSKWVYKLNSLFIDKVYWFNNLAIKIITHRSVFLPKLLADWLIRIGYIHCNKSIVPILIQFWGLRNVQQLSLNCFVFIYFLIYIFFFK